MNKKTKLNISLFLVTAIIISFIVPNYSTFSYNFQLGQTWKGDNIIATVDFPVEKTNQEYEYDVEKHLENYIPIYELDTIISKNILQHIALQYDVIDTDDKIESNNKQHGNIVYQTIENILKIGIIDSVGNISGKNIVKIISNGTIKYESIKNLYSYQQVIKKIQEELSKYGQIASVEILKLNDIIRPNIKYNNSINQINKQKEIDKIAKTKGFISKGSPLIVKSEKIDKNKFHILESYKTELYKQGAIDFSFISYFGYLIYVIIIMLLSFFSLKSVKKGVMINLKNILFLVFLYLISVLIMAIVAKQTSISTYAVPLVIVPLYISAFFNTKIAIQHYIYILLITSMLTPEPIEFITINFLGGMVATIILKSTYRRHVIMKASLGAFLTFIITHTSMCMITGDYSNYIETSLWLTANAVMVVMLYQFLFLIEKTFNFVTNITLFDLCDTNRALLKELSLKAPGTFQHSIQVANLSENAAKAIGANHLLAKTGALYHDIGKMLNPNMFIENISSGKKAHTGLTPKQSAEIIKSHVAEGAILAKKNNLPEVVIEFIERHHGNSLIYFFYRNEVDAVGVENIDEADFRYNGPKPVSKEASICMICDSVEAASRAIDEYTEESISATIESVLSTQIKNGLLSDSSLEIKDIKKIKESLKASLINTYHSRIAYPQK